MLLPRHVFHFAVYSVCSMLLSALYRSIGLCVSLSIISTTLSGTFDPEPHGESACSAGELTHKELEALQLLADGLSNSEIADALSIGQNTVETHLRHIYQKLGVNNRTQAAIWYKAWREEGPSDG